MQTISNNITLVGNMAAPANITNFENGNKVARFSVATQNSNMEKQDKAQWHRLFAWGNMAEFIENFGDKGKKVAVHGRVVSRTYLNKSGKPRKVTEIEVKHIIGI